MLNNIGAAEAVLSRNKVYIPNILTLIRIAFVPLICFCLVKGYPIWAAGLFLVAALTDLCDGYLARKWGVVTRFGALSDPLADKILVATILFLPNVWLMTKLVIISREVLMIIGRFLVKSAESEKAVRVDRIGKWKSVIQYVGMIYSMLVLPGFNYLMAFAALITAASGINYSRKFATTVLKKQNK